MYTCAPPLTSPANAYLASPESTSASRPENISSFWNTLYLPPTVPSTDCVASLLVRTVANVDGTSRVLTPSFVTANAWTSASCTCQSRPACCAASFADVAVTASPIMRYALRRRGFDITVLIYFSCSFGCGISISYSVVEINNCI